MAQPTRILATRRRRFRIKPILSEAFAATGRRLRAGEGFPLGRPRWEARMVRAPFTIIRRIVGSEAWIRRSSAIAPSSIGTLKSTRQKTLRPPTFSFRTDNFPATRFLPGSGARLPGAQAGEG